MANTTTRATRAQSNKANAETSVKTIENNYTVVNENATVGSVQITEGMQFHFEINEKHPAKEFCTTETFEQNGQAIEYDQLHTSDGDTLSLSQVIRRRNGINLQGETPQERFNDFFDMVANSEKGVTLEVAKVVNASFYVTNAEGEKEERHSKQFVFNML